MLDTSHNARKSALERARRQMQLDTYREALRAVEAKRELTRLTILVVK